MNIVFRTLLLILFFNISQVGRAQDSATKEKVDWLPDFKVKVAVKDVFPKVPVWVEFNQGFNQTQHMDKLYFGSLHIVPQVRFPFRCTRLGLVMGTFYQGNEFGPLSGPRLTINLFGKRTEEAGLLYTIQLFGEYLIGTQSGAPQERMRGLLGVGVGFSLSDRVTVSVKLYQDQLQPVTYAQFGLAYMVNKGKTKGLSGRTGGIRGRTP